MAKPILISGVQPSGKLHIGNYLGALKNFVELQNSDKYDCYFFVADLHSLTENFNPEAKIEETLSVVSDFLAAGIDPEKSTIFIQSQAPACTELTWVLDTITPLGELQRMTQFKDKSQRQQTNINAGLFSYPVLMAADIILYDAGFVPVGEDQLQHLEFTRTLTRKFNKKFGEVFVEPKPLLTKTPRLMSLIDPEKKMSKSDPNGCLFLEDSEEEIQEKIRRAVTDSGKEVIFDEKNKPAISNLMLIYEGFSGLTTKEIEEKFKGKTYVEFKTALAELLVKNLREFQDKKSNVLKPKILAVAKDGAEKAREKSEKKLEEVKKKLGLLI
ncbi:MAG: tryptophan--tRNA ligase [Candidatus Paceibacterota bacterium]|jgi:tryptophanyl-tRNA synthetase